MSFDGIQLESKILAWRQILEKSTSLMCSSVSSRESVRIAFIIVVLSKLDFHIAIIGNCT
jgi:ADP-ribosylglycohydrolase